MTMLMNPEAPLSRAQKLASGAGAWVTVGIVVLVATTVAEQIGAPLLEGFGENPKWQDVVRTLAGNLVLAMPSILLACALWELKKVLDEYERASFFTHRASRAVRHAGEWALWALGYKIIAAQTLYGFITQTSRRIEINFESFDLGLIAFAGFVMLVGRVLEAATAIKKENDEIV
jgi:hypothetical protein